MIAARGRRSARDRAHPVNQPSSIACPRATWGAALRLSNPAVRPGHRAGLALADVVIVWGGGRTAVG